MRLPERYEMAYAPSGESLDVRDYLDLIASMWRAFPVVATADPR